MKLLSSARLIATRIFDLNGIRSVSVSLPGHIATLASIFTMLKHPPFGTMGDVAQIWQLLPASTTFPWMHQDEEEGRE